jgi:hypothetical protein
MSGTIFRDDDISKDTDLKRLKEIHSLFFKYKVVHTVALICKGIEENKELIKYMQKQVKNGSMDIQVHCWEHYKLTDNPGKFNEELPLCIETITHLFGTKPTILFPPWNLSDFHINDIAFRNGLKVSTQKMSLSGYLKGQKEEVINFHSWANECVNLEAALKKYINI